MFENYWKKRWLIFSISLFFLFSVLQVDALARAGGGRTSGSRGSRSYTPPRSYSIPKPAQPAEKPKDFAASSRPSPQPQSSFLRGLGGGIFGGLIGGMLFRSLGFGMGGEGFGGGFGLFEILLIGALLYGIYWFIKRRRQASLAEGYYQSTAGTAEPTYQPSYEPSYRQGGEEDSLEQGLGFIRQMDPNFDEGKFRDLSMDHFFKIQGAWVNRNMQGVKNLLTEEMYRILRDDAEKMKQEKKMNRLENMAVRQVDIVEAWQESGQDYITVRFYASLLDYTVDESTGEVLSGSKTEPIKFEEYWTFTRAVGNNTWQLSAINQPE